MAAPKKLTVKQVCGALDETRGMIYLAAMRLQCSRKTVHNYINKYPEVQECLSGHRGILIDMAEYSLVDKVKDGDWNAIKYVLDRLGKSRGFGDEIAVDLTLRDEREQVHHELMEVLQQTGARLRDRGYTGNGSHSVTK